MSTRSIIAAKLSDGSIKAIYVHHDGYGHLPVLKENYNFQEKVEELINLGDLSVLEASTETCRAYSRDMGEDYEENAPISLYSFQEIKDLDWNQEYFYTWDGFQWQGFNINGDQMAVVQEGV